MPFSMSASQVRLKENILYSFGPFASPKQEPQQNISSLHMSPSNPPLCLTTPAEQISFLLVLNTHNMSKYTWAPYYYNMFLLFHPPNNYRVQYCENPHVNNNTTTTQTQPHSNGNCTHVTVWSINIEQVWIKPYLP